MDLCMCIQFTNISMIILETHEWFPPHSSSSAALHPNMECVFTKGTEKSETSQNHWAAAAF